MEDIPKEDPSEGYAGNLKEDSNSNKEETLEKEKMAPHKRFVKWTKNLTKKQKIILVLVLLIIIAGTCASALYVLKKQPGPLSGASIDQSKEVPSEMTGLMVLPEVNEKQVTAVMIENSPDARPQAGLYKAGVVYEAVAEGGITRFMALYQDTSASKVGPIRSARPYYLDWLVPYDAAIAHVGGSPQALAQIKSQNIKDLDQFANPEAYDRVSSRFPPHNVYSSTKRLDQVEKKRGYKKSKYEGFERERREDPLEKPKVKTVSLSLSDPLYNVQFKYNKKCNCYKRFMAGSAHKDEESKKQISPKVVLAIEMQRTISGQYSVYKTTGSGKVKVYQNGTVINGKWKKKNRKSQFTFVDKKGNEIRLAPGKTWVTIAEPGKVIHKP